MTTETRPGLADASACQPGHAQPDAAHPPAAGPDPSQPPATRPDSELAGLDVSAALRRAIGLAGPAQRMLLADTAIVAAAELERLGTGPAPAGFLGRFVRAAGIPAALRLREPLAGAQPTALARRWLRAALIASQEIAVAAAQEIATDHLVGGWLEMVATLMAARRSAARHIQIPAPAQPAGETAATASPNWLSNGTKYPLSTPE